MTPQGGHTQTRVSEGAPVEGSPADPAAILQQALCSSDTETACLLQTAYLYHIKQIFVQYFTPFKNTVLYLIFSVNSH